MQQQKKSKIIVSIIVILLIGYGINQIFQSKKQKDQIIKHDMMIGECAKSKTGMDSKKYEKLKTHDDIKSCLLYTSPSPRDRQKSRMPSSA